MKVWSTLPEGVGADSEFCVSGSLAALLAPSPSLGMCPKLFFFFIFFDHRNLSKNTFTACFTLSTCGFHHI